MKPGLKRIEATLHHLGAHKADSDDRSVALKSTYSFEIYSPARERNAEETGGEGKLFASSISVQPFSAKQNHKVPTLPKIKAPNFTSHRNGSNPALAMGLLTEIQTEVAAWETELQQIVRQIQDIYMEGPIVDGWLESHAREPEPGSTALRHAEVDRLMDYVEEIYSSEQGVTCESPRAGYRLCGLDAAGKMWSRPCPPDQLPGVSVAIARHQKLRQLLGRKQYLETRLSQLAETLVVLHSHLQSS
jgi:hypothetical protein